MRSRLAPSGVERLLASAVAVLLIVGVVGAFGPAGARHRPPLVRLDLAGASPVVGSLPAQSPLPATATPGPVPLAAASAPANPAGASEAHPVQKAVRPSPAALPTPSASLPAVAPLTTLRSADALVRLPASISPTETAAVVHTRGIDAIEKVDTGTVSLAGAPAITFGVDPGTFRAFTPQKSAAEDRLWQYAAGGSLISSYEMADGRSLKLGAELPVAPSTSATPSTQGWLGAFASLGLPGVDLVVAQRFSAALGLTPNNGLIVSASRMGPTDLQSALRAALPGAQIELLHPGLSVGNVTGGIPAGPLSTMLTAALSRVGMPYVWGATGPDAFDCSGLVAWSFAQAGISMPRTAAQQYLTGLHVPFAAAVPGDLLAWTYEPADPTYIDHIAIYLGNGMMIVAPHTGLDVQVVPVPLADFAGAVRVSPMGAAVVGGPRVGAAAPPA